MSSENSEVLFGVFLVVVAGMVIACALAYRYKRRELEHRERLAALDKGVPLPAPDPKVKTWTPRVYLLRGLMWLFTGISISLLFGGLALSARHGRPVESKVLAATHARAIGATEEQVRAIMEDHSENDGPPPALALFGLIPAGVGLAYLITYRVERQQDRNVN